ncbi:hypothetical protein GE234_004549 [Escherichia coli]|nr:hypothetical protein [Escherichia coli]
MNERLKTHSKTQKKSADLVSNKLRIGVFQQYQMKCKSVSKKSPRYRMEEKIDAVIREKYGLPPVMSTPVKYADLIMLATERRDLGLDDGSFWPVLEGIPATEMFKVIPLAPSHAYGMFMERFNELSELRTCA